MAIYANDNEDFDLLVRQEELILDVTERLTRVLDDAGVTRTELARRLGRTPGYVSQILGGGRNLTLRTVADVATALSMRPVFSLTPEHGLESEFLWTPGTRPRSTVMLTQDLGDSALDQEQALAA